MASWATIQSLLIFFGPLLLPRALAYYRSLQTARAQHQAQIRPISNQTSYALGLLFVTGVAALLSTLPVFQPTNIFAATHSRLQTTPNVLLTRLAALRPLTAADKTLRDIFEASGLEARLLYARFGPAVILANAQLSSSSSAAKDADAGLLALLTATPGLLGPHVLHVAALGIATSRALGGGRDGARWRTVATIAGLVLGLAEFAFVAAYDDRANARATWAGEVEFVFWKVRVWRGLAIAAVDGLLGWVIWLQASGRAFLVPTSAGERVADVTATVDRTLGRLRTVGILRNGVLRSREMRGLVEAYWVKEGEVMKDVFEEPEVLLAQRNALRRIDTVRIEREAENYLDSTLAGLNVPGHG